MTKLEKARKKLVPRKCIDCGENAEFGLFCDKCRDKRMKRAPAKANS